jgi:hypothetical protein
LGLWQNRRDVLYLRALGVGLLSAVGAAALYFAVKETWAFLYIALVLAPRAEAASGSSWDAFYPQSLDIRGPLIIGFVVGFWWMLRRQAVAPREPFNNLHRQ